MHSAAELLPQLLENNGVVNGTGSIAFTRTDRTTSRVFLREGSIYAVDHLEYEKHLWDQLKFEEHIAHGNLRALIRSHKSQRDSLYKLLKKSRSKVKNEESLIKALQEYTLGTIDDLYSKNFAKIEWKLGDTDNYFSSVEVPPFGLDHALTLAANRYLYKHEKYEEWGFKNDDQFYYGNVHLEGDYQSYEPATLFEAAIIKTAKFTVKGLMDTTGYSSYTIVETLADMSEKIKVVIENPAGRQAPEEAPLIPAQVPIIRNKVHFSVTDEDPDMVKLFNTEYHVPEPAYLDDEHETFNSEHKILDDDPNDEALAYFDAVLRDSSTMEVGEDDLPKLQAKKEKEKQNQTAAAKAPSREEIAEEMAKDDAEDDSIEQLYRSAAKETANPSKLLAKPPAKTTKTSEEPATEPQTKPESEEIPESAENTPTNSEGNEMSSDSTIFELLEKVEDELINQKGKVEQHKRNIEEQEARLKEAKLVVSQISAELALSIAERDAATADYEKARKIIESFQGK